MATHEEIPDKFVQNKESIHVFALKYYELCAHPRANTDIALSHFDKDVEGFGFEMDLGQRFMSAYSPAAYAEADSFNDIAENIENIGLLGSAIVSRWQHITHWMKASPLSKEYRPWFISAFAQLVVITSSKPFTKPFQGTLQKMQLVSNTLRYAAPDQSPEGEIEQRLTITTDGRVWLTRYANTTATDMHLLERTNFKISQEAVRAIMVAVMDCFETYTTDFPACCASWYLTLTNTNGKQFHATGPMWRDLVSKYGGLSSLIRVCTNRDDLFVFDGNPDIITFIDVRYCRTTTEAASQATMDSSDTPQAQQWSHTERLTLNRETETLKYHRIIDEDCTVTSTYHIEDGLALFMDSLDLNALSRIEGNPPDVAPNPQQSITYTISITTKRGVCRSLTNSFDKKGLPDDWPEFAKSLYDFMSLYGLGELFDEAEYGKTLRRNGELVFCHVIFEENGHTYCYLADEDVFHEGDFVLVPAGDNVAVGQIESVEYKTAEQAPYPLDKIKRIICKYTDEDFQ